MWILKNPKDLMEIIYSRSLYSCYGVKPLDVSILYTEKSHTLLKSRLKYLILKKNEERQFKYILVSTTKTYLVQRNRKSKNKYTDEEVTKSYIF